MCPSIWRACCTLLANRPCSIWPIGDWGERFRQGHHRHRVQLHLFGADPSPAVPIIADPLTSCLIGGLGVGFAAGLVLSCGCSTGGLDILGLYLSKKNPKFTVGRFCICFNVCLYTLCLFLFNATTAIYSAIYNILNNLFLDKLHQQNVNVEMLIFTKKNNPELVRFIIEKLDRGVTYWTAHGAYTGDEVQVLCVCLSKYEIGTLQQVMQEMDPKAFFIVQEGVHTGGNYRRHLN